MIKRESCSICSSCDLEKLKSFYFYITKSDKVYITNHAISSIKIDRINSVGLYFGTFHNDERFRFSIEGSRFINPKRNFVKLNK